MLTKEEILSKGKALNFETVQIEGLGEVGIREMTAGERDRLEAAGARGAANPTALHDLRARFCAAGMCDANGKRIFDDGDVGALSGMNASVIDAIFEHVLRINKMGKSDIDDAEKN